MKFVLFVEGYDWKDQTQDCILCSFFMMWRHL